jgi:hypothetical protein
MYIRELRVAHTFFDQNGKPWPRASVVLPEAFPQHWGMLDYLPTGEQIVLHKSKKLGQAVVTWPHEYMDRPGRYRVLVPRSDQQADEWLNGAYIGVEIGELWLPFDDCQDFISRAVTGHDGSPTRDGILSALVFGGGLALAAHLFSEPSLRRRSALC